MTLALRGKLELTNTLGIYHDAMESKAMVLNEFTQGMNVDRGEVQGHL